MSDVIPIRKFERPEILEPRVLGALLDNGPHLKGLLAASGLVEECFPTTRGRAVWKLIAHLVAGGREVSALTVVSAGRLAHMFGEADEHWIEELQLSNVVTPEQLGQLLGDMRRARRALDMAELFTATRDQLLSRGLVDDQVWGALNQVRAMLQAETPDAEASANLHELLDKWERNQKAGRPPLVPTGIRIFDELFGGYPHTLTLLAAAPGSGKNGVIASGIRSQLEADPAMKIGLFALEGGDAWLHTRHLAHELGVPVRAVAGLSKPEELAARDAAAEKLFALWSKRVFTFTQPAITPGDLLRRAAHWVRLGVRIFYIDNASHLKLRAGSKFEQPHELLAEALQEFVTFAEENAVAFVLLMHTNEPERKSKTPGPPELHMMRGGRASDQKARLALGLWRKDTAWRCTLLKGNDLAEAGQTVEFERYPEAALINPDGGRLVNLQQESAIERKQRNEERDAERIAAAKKRALTTAQAKAEAEAAVKKAAEPAEQAALPLESKP
jgi:replicative DNA helicase